MASISWLDRLLLPEPTPALANLATGTLNDIASQDLAGNIVSAIRFTGVAPTVTGVSNPYSGRRIHLHAVGGPLVLANENASSTAANRIKTGTGANVTIAQDGSAFLVYDDGALRWRLVASGLMTDGGTPLANASTGTLNDVATTDATGAESSAVRFSGVAPTINGFASGRDGRRMFVLATGGPVVLADQNAGSAAANRIVTGTGGSVTVPNGGGGLLVYDGTSSRWRVVAIGAASGGSSSTTGTGFWHNTAGSLDAASKKVDLTAAADVTVPATANGVVTSSGTVLQQAANVIATSNSLSIGATPATAGELAFKNAFTAQARNNANSVNLTMFTVTSGDDLNFWATSASYGTVRIYMPAAAILSVEDATVYRLRLSQTQILCSSPLAGDNLQPTPFRLDQADVVRNAATDYTLVTSEYICPVISVTGTPGGAFNIIAPNTAKSFYIVKNGTTGGFALTFKKAGGAGIAIAAGKIAMLRHDGTDYARITADT